MRSETVIVEQTLLSERLDHFLRDKLTDVSRGTIQRLIEEGQITIDGKKVKATHHPRAGEIIEIRFPEAKPAEAQAENIPLDILFEDKDLLVLNKPAGLVVHPAAGHEEGTLVNALLHHCAGKLSGIGGVARPGIVHRLDKDTSGCVVVAKNDAAHLKLAEQFAGRSLEKIYHAIVCGEPQQKGEIEAAIARHPTERKRMAIIDSGREARTSWKVVERLKGSALLEVELHTGRTHQIRVHFQFAGFPILGDDVYGLKQNKKLTASNGYTAPRQLLHASRLTFIHPRTGKKIKAEAPLPEDFKKALVALKK